MNAKFDGHCRLQKITGCDGIKKGEPIVNQDKNYNSHASCWDVVDEELKNEFTQPDREDGDHKLFMDIQSLVEGVKDHAYRHYNEEGGWDFVIETMEDEDIAGLLKGVGEWVECGYNAPVATLEQAIKRLETLISLWDEQRYNYLV